MNITQQNTKNTQNNGERLVSVPKKRKTKHVYWDDDYNFLRLQYNKEKLFGR